MEATIILGRYRGCIGIMEKKMETTIILERYRGCTGMMEKKTKPWASQGRALGPKYH